MKCLVLGGGGFLGSHLCDALTNAGHTVRILHRKDSYLGNLEHLRTSTEFVEGDFGSESVLRAVVKDMDIVYHFLSTTVPKSSNENPIYDLTTNAVPSLHLLDIMRDYGAKKIIFASSGGTVYGMPREALISEDHPTNPICAYGVHKLMIEKYLEMYHQNYGLDYAVMRISNPYGTRQSSAKGQGIIVTILNRIKNNQPIEIWGDGSLIRDYIYVSDVIRAALTLMTYSGNERTFNIASGVGKSLRSIITEIRDMIATEVDVRYGDARPFDVPVNVLDITRAKLELNWEPTVDLTSGIKLTMDYLLGQSQNQLQMR